MNDEYSENEPEDNFEQDSENTQGNSANEPVHAQFQHKAVTARLREDIRGGAFANAAIVLSGNFEFVLDFILRLGKPDLVTARVILPIPVADQFVQALADSLKNYERQFGDIPEIPQPTQNSEEQSAKNSGQNPGHSLQHDIGGFIGATTPEGTIAGENFDGAEGKKKAPGIDDIYDDLKLEDELLGGVYANAVLLRHSATEFCFDFVTNIYPKSSVNARVFMAAPQVKPLFKTLSHSVNQFRNRQNPNQNPPAESD